MRIKYLFPLLFLVQVPLDAQEFLDLIPKDYCQYWGDTLEHELYKFAPNEDVPQAVQKILSWSGREANFELVQCNASSVAAVRDGDKRYLLYSQNFFSQIPTALEAYALLAHEIGHHLNGHRFDACCRHGEELEADQFMGFVLYKSNLTDSLGAVSVVHWKYKNSGFRFSKTSALERSKAIARGWSRSDAAVRARSHLAYYDNQENIKTGGLRSFPWPPPSCAERYTVRKNMTTDFATVGKVDDWLRRALDKKRYWSRSYHYLPNGFALVTRLEQFNSDGSCMADDYRWVDYPVGAGSEGLLDYLYALFMPRKGYFRVFVFAVTDAPAGSSGKPIERAAAQKWLENATSNLPYDIANTAINEKHFVEVLVYEFEASDSNLKAERRCPCAKPCRVHLDKSGLLKWLK